MIQGGMIKCGCHCIKCGSTDLESRQAGPVGVDGYYDIHHTCRSCKTHFDHLDGQTFASCEKCGHY